MTKKQLLNNAKRNKVTFSITAADAKEVYVLGDFNRWQPNALPMKKEKDGVWEGNVVLPQGRYEYKFLVDGQWMCDPMNEQVCENCFGSLNNVVDVSSG